MTGGGGKICKQYYIHRRGSMRAKVGAESGRKYDKNQIPFY